MGGGTNSSIDGNIKAEGSDPFVIHIQNILKTERKRV